MTEDKTRITRRNYLKYAATGVVGLAVGAAAGYMGAAPSVSTQTVTQTVTAPASTATMTVAPATTATAAPGTLSILTYGQLPIDMINWPELTALENKIGMKVSVTRVDWSDLASKQMLSHLSPTALYDIMTINSSWHIAANAPYLTDLTPYFARDNYDTTRYYPGILDEIYWWKGDKVRVRSGGDQILGLPGEPFAFVALLRKDILEKNGIAIPTVDWTVDEFENIARKIKNPSAGFYGSGMTLFQSRGLDIVTTLAKGYSGDPKWCYLTKDIRPNVDSPECLDMTKKVKDWLDEGIVHPGALELASGMDFELYKKGVVGMDISWWALDPKLNPYVDNTIYLPPPRFKQGQTGQYGQHCLSIPTNSTHKDAAWEFMKWFDSDETQLRMVTDYAMLPNLAKYVDNPDIWKLNPNIEPYPAQFKAGLEQLPKIDIGMELGLIIGTDENAYWSGTKTLDQATADMVSKMNDSLKKAGYET